MHNVTSPNASADLLEAELQAKGKTAPRITPSDLEAAIKSEHYFTAADGVVGLALMQRALGEPDTTPAEMPPELLLLTICVLILNNGFMVTGESACVSAENFDADVGRKVARDHAVNKMWPLMGFALKSRIQDANG